MKHKIIGNGPVIILFRGLGRTFDYWLGFEKELAKNFKVVMINLPGTDNEEETTPLTIKSTVNKLATRIHELKSDIGEGPYNIFGLSLGGIAAMGLAYYHSDLVNTLTIVSSSITQMENKRLNPSAMLKLLTIDVLPGKPPYPNKKIAEYLVSPNYLKEHPELIRKWDRLWIEQDMSKTNFVRQLVSALFSLTPEMVRKIDKPTIVISGEEDMLVPYKNSETIKQNIKNSIHIRIPSVGHDLTTEKPELICDILKDFTNSRSPQLIKEKYQPIKEPLELTQLKRFAKSSNDVLILEELATIEHIGYRTPINAFFVGHKPKPELPTVALFSCFHGVEWIGGQVLVNFIEHLVREINWDEDIKNIMNKVNVCGIVVVNPVGRLEKTRSNGNGIDLMRNSPIRSEHALPILGGQKFSRHIPWYMGEGLEKENEITAKFLDDYVFPSDFKITIDIHSAFLRGSRIWIPYASGKKLPEKEAKIFRDIRKALNSIYRYNPYKYQKQDIIYKTHGDFWDYNFERHNNSNKTGTYLPMTLEISSLDWSVKNFLRKWSLESLFNPTNKREINAEYIKHIMVLDFIIRFAKNYSKK